LALKGLKLRATTVMDGLPVHIIFFSVVIVALKWDGSRNQTICLVRFSFVSC